MITILTEPTSKWSYKWFRAAKNFAKKYVLKRPILPYSGHFAVTRSLIEGLKKGGEPFIYNPTREKQITEHVHVLAGVNTLKYAIWLKKNGRIKRLTAGPNIVVSSADYNGLIASKEIDLCLANSEWVKSAYIIDNSALRDRISYFPSGVDADFWSIKKTQSSQLRFLFYKKRPEPVLYEECIQIALSTGANVREIFYGKYTLDQLKTDLSNTDFVVYFVEQESQGIALAEIWATNTPTIVWNPGFWTYKLKNYQSSSAPYLTSETGMFFRTADDFRSLFLDAKLTTGKFDARNWVLKNMTDEVCTNRFLKIVKKNLPATGSK